MRNFRAITTNQAAIAALFQVISWLSTTTHERTICDRSSGRFRMMC